MGPYLLTGVGPLLYTGAMRNSSDYTLTIEYREEIKKPRSKRKWVDDHERRQRRFNLGIRVGYDDWEKFDG